MIAKIIVVLALLTIIGSLVSALFYLVKDQQPTPRTAKALTRRIALSIILFVFLVVCFATGVIQPHGLNPGVRAPAPSSE